MNSTTVGLDVAKKVFHLVGLDAQGREQLKKKLSRSQVLKHFANSPACNRDGGVRQQPLLCPGATG